MRAFSTLKGFFLLVLLVPFLASCSDSTGPDDVSYPVTMEPKSVTGKSTVRAFVREGSTWREITSENPDILTNAFFAESAVVQEGNDVAFTLTSATQWQGEGTSAIFTYSYSDDKFVFESLFGVNFYATGDYDKFNLHMVAGVAIHDDGINQIKQSLRTSYASGSDPATALTSGSFALGVAEGDTLAYQTFDLVYEKK